MHEIKSTARRCHFLKDLYNELNGFAKAYGKRGGEFEKGAPCAIEGVIEEVDRLADSYEYSKEE